MDKNETKPPVNSNVPIDQYNKGNDNNDSGVGIIVSQDMILPGAVKPRHLAKTETLPEGALYYVDVNGNFAQLGVGTSSQILTSNGTIPAWAAPAVNVTPTVVALSGTTPTINCTSPNQIFTITLSGNTTYSISNVTAPYVFMVEVKQGSGTTYTNTWFSTITWITPSATAPVQTTTSNGYTVYGFRALTASTFLGYLVGTN